MACHRVYGRERERKLYCDAYTKLEDYTGFAFTFYAPAAVRVECYCFQPALELQHHLRYLLMDNSSERATTIGFRCTCAA